MLDKEKVVMKIQRNPLYLVRGAIDFLIAVFFYNLYRSAISAIPFWDEWRLVTLYRAMSEDFFDQVFAVPANWIGWILLVVAAYFLYHGIRRYLTQLSTAYMFTDIRVMKKTGVFSVTTQELLLRSIDGVSRQQSLLGRVFGYGTLRISGRGIDVLEWTYVRNLAKVKESIENQLLTDLTSPSQTIMSNLEVDS